ncbi:MAG TPA: disulfide bond formation protein B [Gammaproteobacteria bacterium]|nr:disulfide bond formation protein B [Gammaproteobacteria bacterium]
MLNRLAAIGGSAWYWLTVLVAALSLEAVALYYQYALDYYPCVVCIHVRIWVLGFILVALLGLFVRRYQYLRTLVHGLTIVLSAGLLERSWMLLGIERGTVEGSCSFESGLPAWFALDQWFPAVFKVLEACGYTPELLFGITMAESLVVIAVIALLISVAMTVASLSENFR